MVQTAVVGYAGGVVRWVSLGLASALLASGTPNAASARGSAVPFELEWRAPEGCFDARAARATIEEALGPARPGGEPVVVRVTISEVEPGRWSSDVWMYDDDASGERSISGASCDEVARATALVLALALDRRRQAGADPPPSAAGRNRASSDELHFSIGVRALGDVGSLPAPDLGVGLQVAVLYRRFVIEASGAAWLPRTLDPESINGKFQLYTGAVRGCFLFVASPRLGLGPCVGGELGGTYARGDGLDRPHGEMVGWAAGLFGVSARAGTSPFAELLVEVGVPLHRAAWQVDGIGRVFQPEPVVGRASLGVNLLLP